MGEILAKAFQNNLSSELLPDGHMYYNIAQKVVAEPMRNNYKLVSRACADVQTSLNRSVGLGLNGVTPDLNQDRIQGILNLISGKEQFDDIKYMLDEPVVNFTQSVVDDSIKKNAECQYQSGLSPKIKRTSTGKCCKWCNRLVGTYEYAAVRNTGNDVFRRHKHCRCTVEFITNGKVQNVHTKKWKKESVDVENTYLIQSGIKNNGIHNKWTVNYKLVNSKEFHDKFEKMPLNKNLREGLYKNSLEILEKQNGTCHESIVILDSRTGIALKKVHGKDDMKAKISLEGLSDKKITILHNHPEGGRFSYADIKNYFQNVNIDNAVVIGHNGEVHIVYGFDRNFDIVKFYEERYNKNIGIYPLKSMAQIKTMNDIYKKGVMIYEKM